MKINLPIANRNYVIFLPNITVADLANTTIAADNLYIIDEERNLNVIFNTSSDKQIPIIPTIEKMDELPPVNDDDELNPHSSLLDELDMLNATSDQQIIDDLDDEIVQINSTSQLLGVLEQPELKKAPTKYDELPKVFYNADKLPKSINLLCWSCSNVIEQTPWFLPITSEKISVSDTPNTKDIADELVFNLSIIDSDKAKHRSSKSTKIMKINGVFCHIPCMGRYLEEKIDKSMNKWQVKTLIKDMFKLVDGHELVDVPISEDPHIMQKFSGPTGVSESDYYKTNLIILERYIKK